MTRPALWTIALVVSLLAARPARGESPATGGGVKIEVWRTPLPAVVEPWENRTVLSDINVPGTRIVNGTGAPITLESVTLELRGGGHALAAVTVAGDALGDRIGRAARFVKSRSPMLDVIFGGGFIDENKPVAAGLAIGPAEQAYLVTLTASVLGSVAADEARFVVAFTGAGGRSTVERVVPVQRPRLQNDYRFPLRGAWVVSNNWDDRGFGHRNAAFTHFSGDYYQLGADGTIFKHEPPRSNDDIVCYGAPVLAPADAVVAAVADGEPDNAPGVRPSPSGNPKGDALLRQSGGNYVILRHAHGEHSLLGHLKPGSIRVKPGDHVKAGDPIALIGNGGNSDYPHLHFQIMDGADPLRALTFPLEFTNLLDEEGKPLKLVLRNRSIVHTRP